MEQLFNILIWAAVFQGVFLGIVFISSNESRSNSNKLLGLFLIALVIEALGSFLPYNEILGYSVGYYFELPEVKVLIPLLFTNYVFVKIGVEEKYKTFLRLNYGFGFMVIGITLVNFILVLITGKGLNSYLSIETMEKLHIVQFTYAVVLTIVGLALATVEVTRYRKMASSNYADMDMLSISWLWRLILLLFIAAFLWSLELVRVYIGLLTGNFSSWDFVSATWGVLIIFIYFVSYRAFKKRDLLEGLTPVKELKKPSEAQDDSDAILAEKLEEAMSSQKMYLDTDLTLYDVAKNVGASTRKVSNFINSTYDQNFSEWVNQYRVEEVKDRFKSTDSENLTIEAIGLESGFKSRSAMYAAFKKFTGASPANFKT